MTAACALLAAGGLVAVALALRSGPAGPAGPAPGLASSGGTHPTAGATRPASPAPLAVGAEGTYRIARRSFVLAEHAQSPRRRRLLRVTVRYPVGQDVAQRAATSGGLFPLLVFAPGFRQCAGSYRDLLRQWAGAGYVVAAVDFPRTSCSVANPDEADLSNQPADVSYVIRRLIALSRKPGGPLHGLVSPAEVAVAGHSDGGDTVAAMAGASCCRDRQVRAVVVLAGAEWPPLRGRWFASPAPPMMFVQGTADTWNFPAASQQLYLADTTGRRYYLDLPGADHFAPYEGDGAPEPIVARVTLDFLDYYLLGERGRLAAMRRAGRVPGVATLVAGGRPPS